MRDALEQIGYRVAGVFGRKTKLEELKRDFVRMGLELVQDYDAVEDMPWPLMYRELDEAYPNAKFILTVRDTDRWWKSISGHFGDNPYHLQQLTYGDDAAAPVGHEARYREVYEAHNAAVLEHFKDRPSDLLLMRLEAGDGWAKLGKFLGIDVPDGPFVRTNTSGQRKSIFQRVRKKLYKMGLPVGVMDG